MKIVKNWNQFNEGFDVEKLNELFGFGDSLNDGDYALIYVDEGFEDEPVLNYIVTRPRYDKKLHILEISDDISFKNSPTIMQDIKVGETIKALGWQAIKYKVTKIIMFKIEPGYMAHKIDGLETAKEIAHALQNDWFELGKEVKSIS
jgi:hypothetical protein